MELEEFLAWARGKGWTVEERPVPLSLPEGLTARYPVPEDYRRFLERVLLCSGPMETEWFLCEEQYRQEDPDAMRWNECEELSLAAARDLMDPEEEARVRAAAHRYVTGFPELLAAPFPPPVPGRTADW